MTIDKQLRIYPGIDLDRALRILQIYQTTENAKRVGDSSMCVFGFEGKPTQPDLVVYTMPTAIIIRKANE